MSSLEQHRGHFSGLIDKVYFNFGGQGTLPRAALTAIINAYEIIDQYGPFSLKANEWISQKTWETKTAIANELLTSPETITLTENVTAGCNIVLWGMEWQPGDHLLMTDCEHPGIVAIARQISQRFGVEVSTCPIMATLNQGNPVEVIAQHLQPNTKLVVLSHLLWNTGQVLPLGEIVELCHSRGIPLLVDAAQSVGCLPLNLTELDTDFYAFTAHKWLCGPAGVGGLYVNPKALDYISPTFSGWRGIKTDSSGEVVGWKADGSRFEVATSAYALYEGLKAALNVHWQWGNPQQRFDKIHQLGNYLWENLGKIGGLECLSKNPPGAGLVSFSLQGNTTPDRLVRSLEKQGIFLRTIANPYCVRACVHYFTLQEEIDHLVSAIADLTEAS
jgi:L-cysteine/cystine lyase